MKRWTATLLLLAICLGGTEKAYEAQLRWPDPPKKASMRVRLVAVALADPRSTFFSSHEVFIAEKEITHEEWGLIKLVYTFLPYQPRLLESGFDYSVVHELSAARDPECDETVSQLTARDLPRRHQPLIYAPHVPREDLDRRHIPLPCYETNADEYSRSTLQPARPEPQPTLKARTQQP
jgi:hypothetical protein